MLSFKELFSFTILLTLPLSISCYYNETKYKQLVLHDTSNDDAIYLDTVRPLNSASPAVFLVHQRLSSTNAKSIQPLYSTQCSPV